MLDRDFVLFEIPQIVLAEHVITELGDNGAPGAQPRASHGLVRALTTKTCLERVAHQGLAHLWHAFSITVERYCKRKLFIFESEL